MPEAQRWYEVVGILAAAAGQPRAYSYRPSDSTKTIANNVFFSDRGTKL